MNRRPTFVLVVSLVLVTTAVAFAAAPQKPSTSPPETITLELTDVTVVEAFQRIFKGLNVSYIIQPGVSGTISSLNLKNVPFDNALSSLAKAAGLEVVKEDGIYVIGKNLSAPEGGQMSIVAKQGAQDQQNPQYPQAGSEVYPAPQGEGQDVILGQYEPPVPAQMPYPYNYGYQGGYQGNIGPVYYGHVPPQGYYYGYGYRPYQYYSSPPPYTYMARPNLLPPPGVPWSAGIGEVDIVTPAPKTQPQGE